MSVENSLPAVDVPKRITGTWGLVGLAMGIVIGSGIFKVPGTVFEAAGESVFIALMFWLAGGVIALTGALTTAELAAMFPRQGGTFVYVNEAFGAFWAFAVGWCSCLVGFPASCAAIARVFGEYLSVALAREGQATTFGFVLLCVCALFNLRGSRFSFGLQTVLTGVKVVLVAIFAGALLTATPFVSTADPVVSTTDWAFGFGVVAAGLIPVIWTFDGWQNLVVVAGEATAPERTIVRGLVGTIALVSVLYLLINIGLFRALEPGVLAGHPIPAAAAAEVAFGDLGARLISGLVALTTGTAVFGIFVAGPRFIYAMGKAGFFFKATARLDPSTGAPKVGILVAFAIAAIYFVTSTFGQILAVYAFVGLTVEVLGVLALFALRRQRPDASRPVKVPFYPWVPLLYAAACALLVVGAVSGAPMHCLVGGLLMAVTYPVFRFWKGIKAEGA